MEILDIIITVLLSCGLISGLREGVVKQVAGFIGLIAGILVGKALYISVGSQLSAVLGTSTEVSRVLAFIFILIIIPLLFSLIGWLISRVLHAISLGFANRLLGGLVGVLKFGLFIGIVFTAIEFFDRGNALISKEVKERSVLYYPIYKSSSIFFTEIKEQIESYGMNNESKEEEMKWKNLISL